MHFLPFICHHAELLKLRLTAGTDGTQGEKRVHVDPGSPAPNHGSARDGAAAPRRGTRPCVRWERAQSCSGVGFVSPLLRGRLPQGAESHCMGETWHWHSSGGFSSPPCPTEPPPHRAQNASSQRGDSHARRSHRKPPSATVTLRAFSF